MWIDGTVAPGLLLQTETSTTIWLRSCLGNKNLARIQFRSTWRLEKYPGIVCSKHILYDKKKRTLSGGLVIVIYLLYFSCPDIASIKQA